MNERYLDEAWRQSMRVKLDFNNMMFDKLGNRGIYRRVGFLLCHVRLLSRAGGSPKNEKGRPKAASGVEGEVAASRSGRLGSVPEDGAWLPLVWAYEKNVLEARA